VRKNDVFFQSRLTLIHVENDQIHEHSLLESLVSVLWSGHGCFTLKMPFSVPAVRCQRCRRRTSGEVDLVFVVTSRLIDEFADLRVEREPRDVDLTVTYRQSELKIPHAAAVGVNLHLIARTTRCFFFCTDTRQHRVLMTTPLFHSTFGGGFPLHQIAHVGINLSRNLSSREIIFEVFQTCEKDT